MSLCNHRSPRLPGHTGQHLNCKCVVMPPVPETSGSPRSVSELKAWYYAAWPSPLRVPSGQRLKLGLCLYCMQPGPARTLTAGALFSSPVSVHSVPPRLANNTKWILAVHWVSQVHTVQNVHREYECVFRPNLCANPLILVNARALLC